MNGADPDERTGTSILLKVMAGDKVEMNVDNYYDGTYNSEDDQPVTAEDMLNSIVTTLTTGTGGLGSSESHNPDLVPRLFNSANYTEADEWMHQSDDPSRPKAFLNYILFDEHMQVVRTFTGAWQANGSGGWQTIGNTEPMTIPVNGYLAVYLSNATSFANCEGCLNSEGDVYFDKLNIRFTKGNLKQDAHYYPYGLPMAAIGSSAMGMTLNRQKYQSNEYITEAGLNWMSFGARQYDPQIGRFLSVDPMASAGGQEMLSPYQAMGNDPVSMVDPGGMQTGQPGGNLPNPPGNDPPVLTFSNLQQISPFFYGQTSISGPLTGFTSSVMNDMAGNINTDPMGMGAWMDKVTFMDRALKMLQETSGDVMLVNQGNGVFAAFTWTDNSYVVNGSGGYNNAQGYKVLDEIATVSTKHFVGFVNAGKGNGDSQQSDNGSTTDKMLDKSGKVSTSLDAVAFSSYISGTPKFGAKVGLIGTVVGVISLGNDVHKLSQNKISTSRFGFHVAGFAAAMAADLTLGTEAGAEIAGPYGAAAGAGVGLTFGATEFYYDNVVVPYIAKPFNSSFNSFMRSYFNIPSF